jgi:prepilin-type N-terminal cleavage/methylation domain-containing protein/prepilin-type processing-associated H-X9-DG protein
MPRRYAFTLIELLVVIAIIGTLFVLLTVAAQGVRSATLNLQCKNHLRQLGAAMNAYHVAVGCFPITMTDRHEMGSGQCGTGFYSWRAFLLPYLDRHDVYDQINFDVAMTDDCSSEEGTFQSTHPNATAARAVVEVFLCPADAFRGETLVPGAWAGNDNYAFNMGWPAQSRGLAGERPKSKTNPYNGVFGITTANPKRSAAWHPVSAVTSRDVTDGLQYTAAISERLIHNYDHQKEDPRRHVFCGGSPGAHLQASLVEYCRQVDDPDEELSAGIGQAWISGWAVFGPGYMHLMPPNDRGCRDHGKTLEGGWWLSASSNHAGGVNVLMADGRVLWVDNSVHSEVWWAMGSRDGQEVQRLQED